MPKLRHIAFIAVDPPRLYDFYHALFGFEKVRTGPMGTIHVNDGLVDLAFLLQTINDSKVVGTHRADGHETDQTQGIHHFGFQVSDLEAAVTRLRKSVEVGQTPQNGRPAEMRVVDPWGNKFDVSSRGFMGRDEKKSPAIRYVGIQTPAPESTAEFYKSSLELKDAGRTARGNVRLSDGDVVLDFGQEQIRSKSGIQCFGIHVEDWARTQQRFQQIGLKLPPPDANAEARVVDPEGNTFVVSERGWQA
ncbi:MAG TPA: VOC family protein [Candidatus Binatia bacterium]|jgi:catechol 2,3-dioxygenase-like lactoylglutathione lyase family enzyme